MTKTDVVTKVKKWIENEYRYTERYISSNSSLIYKNSKETVYNALTRSFGIIMFTINELLDYDSEESLMIQRWWDDVMLPKFRELEKK